MEEKIYFTQQGNMDSRLITIEGEARVELGYLQIECLGVSNKDNFRITLSNLPNGYLSMNINRNELKQIQKAIGEMIE